MNFEDMTYIDLGNIQEEPKKPPIGVVPEFIWKERRVKELGDAIKRYIDEGFAIPEHITDEYNKHRKSND